MNLNTPVNIALIKPVNILVGSERCENKRPTEPLSQAVFIEVEVNPAFLTYNREVRPYKILYTGRHILLQ